MVTILGTQIAPAEGEQTVKTYHCTSFKSRLLGITAEGFLEVTNKRVMLQATSKGSLIHSEVPIEDVAGLSLFKGNHFSLKHFLGALVLAGLIGSVASSIMAGFCAIVGDDNGVASYIAAIALLVWASRCETNDIKKSILAQTAATLMATAGGLGMMSGLGDLLFGGGDQAAMAILGMITGVGVGIWGLVLMVKYSIRPTMTLAVNSRGGSNTPIAITGPGFGPIASNAARALEAEPAEDAEAMMKELGALILDIQERGDFGIEKWRASASSQRPILGQEGGSRW